MSADPLTDALRAQDPDALVALLREVHSGRRPSEGLLQGLLSGLGQPAAPSAPEDRYAAARAHFGRREARLNEEAKVTSRMLSSLRSAAPERAPTSPVQQQVTVQCAPTGPAVARFGLRNQAGRATTFRFRPSELRAATGEERWQPVRFDPPSVTLGPRETATVRVTVGLEGAGLAPGSTHELQVEVLAEGEPLLVVWVQIDLVGELL